MKRTLKYFAMLALVLCTRAAFAQPGFSEKVTSFSENGTDNSGSDFWFAPIQNYIDQPDKSIRIYITSLTNTEAYIEFGNIRDSVPVSAEGLATFHVPLSWELKSSGVPENKAIHVWSPYSNLTVYLLSHSPSSSDGMYCIPTQALGTDYVVAGYESLFEGFGSYVYDYPSEFTISAYRDNTIIQITPSTDLRQDTVFPGQDTSISFQSRQTFTVTLNRGEAIQYQAVKAQSADGYDVTGTVIHSSNPVGVVGGSMMPNIPENFQYGDYICDMIPPTSSWGKTYYTTNTMQPQGMTGHAFNMYCFISSVPNQMIYSYDFSTGLHTLAELGPAYDHYFEEDEGANKFFSDEPFMLVQYINSSSFPDGVNGNGDPAEVVINPKENFGKTVLFTAPNSSGSDAPFDNYAIITVNVNDKGVTFDGHIINSYTSQSIDDTFKIYTIPHISATAHIVKSDSGVGVTVYGYGFQETYAWEGSLGKGVIEDTIPPSITFLGDTLCLGISIADSTSGLADIIEDSVSNLILTFDSIFVPGSGAKFRSAYLCTVDPLKPGYLRLIVTDLGGNPSIAYISYSHDSINTAYGFTFDSPGFDTVRLGTQKTLPILTITDTSTLYSITINNVWTLSPEFIFDGGLTANKLPLTLSPLASHSFVITFNPGRDSAYAAPFFAESNETAIHVDTLTGIGYSLAGVADEPRTEVRVTLTPNPAAKSVSLNFSLSQTANVTFELSSMDGKNVFRWNADVQSEGEHLQTIDISSITQGDYIYRFAANGEVTSGKLAILH